MPFSDRKKDLVCTIVVTNVAAYVHTGLLFGPKSLLRCNIFGNVPGTMLNGETKTLQYSLGKIVVKMTKSRWTRILQKLPCNVYCFGRP